MSPRRVRCLPSHQLCAVANFGSDSLTIVRWDGLATASLAGTVAVGDGPVGIGLRADGVNVKVVSTGFNDHTVTVTTLAPDGSLVGTMTTPVPQGCLNPGHATWLPGLTNTIAFTCNGSDAFVVLSP
jgi:hypothetical protein